MKTFQQFNEDIETRRKQLHQRSIEQMQAHKEKVASYQAAQKKNLAASQEREQLKKEIKKELQTEQTPAMEPNEYNKQIARRQATQKSAHIRHVHSELGAEARAQQAAKQARIKTIMSH